MFQVGTQSTSVTIATSTDAAMESIYEKIGKRLREIRLQQGLTQQDLAEKAGISVAFLSFLELGRRKGSLKTYADLGKGLGLELDKLFVDLNNASKGKKPAPALYQDPRLSNLTAAESQAVFHLVKTLRKSRD